MIDPRIIPCLLLADGRLVKTQRFREPSYVGDPINAMVGNLFYGTEGWMSMSDQGYQVYKGESSELLAEEKPTGGDATGLHMQNFLAACRSRNGAPAVDSRASSADLKR